MATDPSIPQTADVSAGPASPRPDTSRPDTSRPDTSRPDTSRPDTSRPDTSRPDTSRPDTSRPDTSLPDTSLPDTSLPDTSLPDTSLPDTSLPDTWRHDTSPASSGSAPLLPSAGTTERGIGRRTILRIASGRPPQEVDDDVAVEAPLEIRVAGEPVATTMRTPGDDHRLALGFLFAESVIKDVRDVSKVSHCGHPSDRGYGDTIDVSPGPGVALDPSRLMGARRGTLVTSACGVCGRATIEDLVARLPARSGARDAARAPLDVLMTAPEALGRGQAAFARTGAVHAAALLDLRGRCLAVAEDVGRHNAVDKVIGRALEESWLGRSASFSSSVDGSVRTPPASHAVGPAVLVVSGRTSFEIVQKAAMAGVEAIVAVSGPTSLAIDLAAEVGIRLAGFVRNGRLNLYVGDGRA